MITTDKIAQFREDLLVYMPMLRQANDTIISEGVSDFPIFVFHQDTIDLGILIAEREKVKGNWNVYATTLEEFVSKKLIKEERQSTFEKRFKSGGDKICLFVLSEMGAQFIFVPRDGEM